MGVQIEVIEGHRLQLSGDVEAILDLPMREKSQGFSLAISDGSLIRGEYDAASECCRFSIEAEGAAIIKITRAGTGDRLDIDWRIDWMVLACSGDTLRAFDADDAPDTRQLVLDIDAKQAA
jgi:hypothetical protein